MSISRQVLPVAMNNDPWFLSSKSNAVVLYFTNDIERTGLAAPYIAQQLHS